jgi:hypothetical protein
MHLRKWVPGLLVLACGVAALLVLSHFEERVARSEEILRGILAMNQKPYTKVRAPDGHIRVTYRQSNETPQDYARRVHQLVTQETLSGHLCTTLTGCQPGGTTEIEHCTPYNGSEPSNQVIAQHEADVAALCEEFDCTDCGD